MALLSRLWPSPNLSSPSPPRPVLTIPPVIAHQQSRTVLITMGRRNFNSKCGISCSWTSGSCPSKYEWKGPEQLCNYCGHDIATIVGTWLYNQIWFTNTYPSANIRFAKSTEKIICARAISRHLPTNQNSWDPCQNPWREHSSPRQRDSFLRQNYACTSLVSALWGSWQACISNWWLA